MTPNERFKEEQRYLNPLPKLEIFEEYLNLRPNKRKVTAESLITIEGKKYSVPPEYINLDVFYQITNDRIVIFLTFHKSYTKRGLSSLYVVLRPVKKSLIPDSFYRF